MSRCMWCFTVVQICLFATEKLFETEIEIKHERDPIWVHISETKNATKLKK